MQEKTHQKLDELKAAGDDAWEDLKAGMDSAKDSLGKAVDKAISRFR